jgi:hypothetical protein
MEKSCCGSSFFVRSVEKSVSSGGAIAFQKIGQVVVRSALKLKTKPVLRRLRLKIKPRKALVLIFPGESCASRKVRRLT